MAGDPPERCPVCGARNSELALAVPVTGSSAPAAAATLAGRRLVIVGGGVGGHTAAETARSLDPSARITLITDEKVSFYSRLNLTRLLAEEVQRDDLFDYTRSWYDEQQVQVLTDSRVISVDPSNKTIRLQDGREIAYDACILTHGSSVSLPPFYRADLTGVCPLRTLGDVDGIIASVKRGTKVAVIGGGVLGLEAAHGAKKRGGSVQVFEYFSYLMPRQLDAASGQMLLQAVAAKGIEAFVGVGVKELVGKKKHVSGLSLADGRTFAADLVIVSTGILPNIDWVKRSGVQCGRGVLVDDHMSTSAPDVYAAGDVAEWRGTVIGLWANAIEQAKIAAANAIGKTAVFQGFLPVTTLKCVGIPLVSIGDIQEDGGPISSRTTMDAAAGHYRRVIFRHGLPVGGILLGSTNGMSELHKLVEGGIELEKLKHKIVPEETLAAVVP